MIKKDIDMSANITEQTVVSTNPENNIDEVDKIFADADQTMKEDIDDFSLNNSNQKKEKKKKRKWVLVLCSVLLVIVLFFVGVIGLTIYTANKAFPGMKASLLNGLQEAQYQLLEIDNEALSPIDLCGKKIILLISIDKLDKNISNMWDLINFTNDMNKGIISDQFINEQDRQEFNRLLKEYEQLKADGHEGSILTQEIPNAPTETNNPYRNDD